MQRKVKLSKICEGLLDTLLSPNVNRTEGKGCDNMSVIIIDFRVWLFLYFYSVIDYSLFLKKVLGIKPFISQR